MASAMHTTMVKGIMAQLSEAGHMSPELQAFFEEKILVTGVKRGRKTTPVNSSSDTDSSSSTQKQKRKYTSKSTGPHPHKVLVSKCIAFVFYGCDYEKKKCNTANLMKNHLPVKRSCYQMVM